MPAALISKSRDSWVTPIAAAAACHRNNKTFPGSVSLHQPAKLLGTKAGAIFVLYLYGALVGNVQRQHGEAPRVLPPQLLELGGGVGGAARRDDAALVAPPQQLPSTIPPCLQWQPPLLAASVAPGAPPQ